jgi:hypothetical protein
MSYWSEGTPSAVTFGDATIGGTPKKVMQYGAFGATQGLLVNAGLSSYTMVWDIMIPSSTTNTWGSLLQTDPTNARDTAYCFHKVGSTYEIGIGQYAGSATFDEWHRIALTVATDTVAGTSVVSSYIDGSPVSSDVTYPNVSCAIDKFPTSAPGFLLLADNDGDTSPGRLSAFYVTDRVMTAGQIAALGGVSAAGILPVPEPSTMLLAFTGLTALLAYAWRKRK